MEGLGLLSSVATVLSLLLLLTGQERLHQLVFTKSFEEHIVQDLFLGFLILIFCPFSIHFLDQAVHVKVCSRTLSNLRQVHAESGALLAINHPCTCHGLVHRILLLLFQRVNTEPAIVVIDHLLDLLEEFRCSFVHRMSLLVKLTYLSFELCIHLLSLLVWNQKMCLLLAFLSDINVILVQLLKLSPELIKSSSILVQHGAVIVDQLVRFFVLLGNDLSYLVNSLIESFLLLNHFEILN